MMGFALLLLIPTIIIFARESGNIKSDIAASQATQIVRKIADKAEEVYYQGDPSRTTIRVNMPDGVQNITFNNREVVISFKNSDDIVQEISQVTPINMTGNLSSAKGVHFIQIKSEGEYVSVTES